MWCSMTVLSIAPVMIWLLLVQGMNLTPKIFAACSVCNARGLLSVSGYDQSNTCQGWAQLSGTTAEPNRQNACKHAQSGRGGLLPVCHQSH